MVTPFDALQRYAADVVLVHDGTREWRAGELLAEISERTQLLREQNVQRLGLQLDNGVQWLINDLAAAQAGCVCVPLPLFFTHTQRQHVLTAAGIDTLIDTQGLQRISGAADTAPALPAGTQKITFTSGTTGTPKGVCLSLEQQCRIAGSIAGQTRDAQPRKHLCALPLPVLLENVAGVYAALYAGMQLALLPLASVGVQGSSGFNVRQLINACITQQAESLILLPQQLHALCLALRAEPGLRSALRLRFIAVGGARVATPILDLAAELQLPVFEGYGLSECASVVCLNTPQAHKRGSVGRVLPHLSVRLATDGELLVSGNSFCGYAGSDQSVGDEVQTGDLARIDSDGFVYITGRKKHQFITAFGRNVAPEWIEAELTAEPEIAQCCVQGEARPVNAAIIVPRVAGDDPQLQARVSAAIDRVNSRLPDYARVTLWLGADSAFTAANGLLTDNGRLRRERILEHYGSALDALFSRHAPALHADIQPAGDTSSSADQASRTAAPFRTAQETLT